MAVALPIPLLQTLTRPTCQVVFFGSSYCFRDFELTLDPSFDEQVRTLTLTLALTLTLNLTLSLALALTPALALVLAR